MEQTGDDAVGGADDELLACARSGDVAAIEQLYRDHLDGARNLARILVGAEAAEELVAESFARVLGQLRSGGGPTSNFRSYLHVTIRNGYRDGLRSTREASASDQPWLFDQPDLADKTPEEVVEGLDETVAVDALSSLPEAWQKVLWHVEVEGRKPAEVATLMDLKPRAVSSLAHRAREGLKRAYLDMHAGPEPAREQCRWVHARMSQQARGDLSDRAAAKFDAHLDDCAECQQAFLVVDQVNQRLAAYVLPIVLLAVVPAGSKALLWLVGGGAAGAAGAGAAAGSGGAGAGGAGGTAAGGTASSAAVVAAAAVAVAAVAAGALAVMNGGDSGASPQRPAAVSSAPLGDDPKDAGPVAIASAPTRAASPVVPVPPAAAPSTPAPTKAPSSPESSPSAPGVPLASNTPAAAPTPSSTTNLPVPPTTMPASPPTTPSPTTTPSTPPASVPPKSPACGDYQICIGPIVVSFPDSGGAGVKLDLPGGAVEIALGNDN